MAKAISWKYTKANSRNLAEIFECYRASCKFRDKILNFTVLYGTGKTIAPLLRSVQPRIRDLARQFLRCMSNPNFFWLCWKVTVFGCIHARSVRARRGDWNRHRPYIKAQELKAIADAVESKMMWRVSSEAWLLCGNLTMVKLPRVRVFSLPEMAVDILAVNVFGCATEDFRRLAC